MAISADVANAERLEAAASAVEEEFGPIDIWINNAMVSVFSPAHKMTPAEFQRVWTGGGKGWAIILLADGPPPPPVN